MGTNGLERIVGVGDEVQHVRTGEWAKVLRVGKNRNGNAARLYVQVPYSQHPKWWKANAVCAVKVRQQ